MAFPLGNHEYLSHIQSGMELRDYFAGQALMGLCGNANIRPEVDPAKLAYELADNMMEARELNHE